METLASGTYQSPAGGCTNSDAGTFTGQRVSMLNGMFIGSFGPENSIPANIVTQLHDDGGNVTGIGDDNEFSLLPFDECERESVGLQRRASRCRRSS